MPTRFILILSFLFYCCCNSHAQNLVPNPSFEEYVSCPNSTNQVDSCIGWQLVYKTPDYFVTCSPYPISIPDNFAGFQMPFEGNAYMGLYTYVWWQFWREIIGAKLLDTLVKGNTYNISMRVSRGNWTSQAYNCAASNKIGLRLTTKPYSQVDTPLINNFAQVYSDEIISDTLDWVLLSWDYVADSSYTHIYIGNFFDDTHTDTTVISPPLGNFGQAYYYIDNVNVSCISSKCVSNISDNLKIEQVIKFNSLLKTLLIDIYEGNTLVNIYNSDGQLINSYPIEETSFINLSNLGAGIYFVQVVAAEKSYFQKILIIN